MPGGLAEQLAARSHHIYDGGHLFVFQDAAALPEVISFLTA